MNALPTFVRDIEREDFWRELAPWMHLAQPRGPMPDAAAFALDEAAWRAKGYLELTSVVDPTLAAEIARAIATLRSRDLHPTFVYVYDEAWQVYDALKPFLSRLLGDDFEVLADVWAWHIDPRTDRGGWPIHRGWYEDVRGPSGAADLVNVWVALARATEKNACMHVVPLSRDPHYPGDLHDLTLLEGLGVALEAAAGSALVWNANVAHWGGTCDPSFEDPRISLSFTAQRRAVHVNDTPAMRPPLSFEERLDLIAEQFGTYGRLELTADRSEMCWSATRLAMHQAAQRLSASRT